ncbi:hypothetical protein GCM10011572_53560 [Pseudoduganella buxea]|uniref:Uncharacterized protein n=1 Tax=Pseudoduganella buxea TaxID=1949069 RepID=A0ABQ1LL84_9BURK|nr:hypothetical protein GCM10011572_53560 [Pseudoduganella buxea]
MYQSHAVRDGVYLSKHSTLYAPRVIVDVGGNGSRGRVQLTHVPFSLCASTHGDECTIEVKTGKAVLELGLDSSSPLEITPAMNFVRFAGDTKSFEVSYLDEQRKRVRIRFDAAQVELRPVELRPARLDR